MKSILIAIACIAGTTAALAQTTSVTKVAPPPVQAKVGPVTIAPSTTTIYTQPNKDSNGSPIPGNQRGSSTNTSYGVTATIPLPESKKK